MRRFVTGVDRLGAFVLGLLLLAIGVGLLAWAVVHFDNATVLTAPGLATAAASDWWPWATAAAGVVLVPLGMRWLLSRGLAEHAGPLTLPGSDRTGRLTVDLGSLASAAADQLNSHPAIRSAKGSAIVDRGAPSIQLKATAFSAETLASAVHAADDVATTATGMLGDAVVVRTRLHVDTKRRAQRRVA
ncbi:alkaline shock response membrane anchor protein AmaP [Mycobacterium sp. IDR2000157661]|nr:alkaline shock response membrane anchor protein AmaP [Mycobacterium sp. IDR2000157661]